MNYRYVIYYGTLLGKELEKGVDLLRDIIINPTFSDIGFEEEMAVIKEELNEWDEELEQFCEDKLFFNCFNKRRIKYPIIGTKESLEDITLNDIKEFYDKYYFPDNTSIVIISSVKFQAVKEIINQYFGKWFSRYNKKNSRNEVHKKNIEYEIPKLDMFHNKREKSQTCKIEMISPIDSLNDKEIKALRIFNQYFGEGINSVLYETLRTENGIIYDVNTKIANENYIKLYKITFNTSEKNMNKAISLVEECIAKLELLEQNIDKEYIYQLTKNFKLKKLFKEEQSIVLAKELATYDSMFGDYKIYINESNDLDLMTSEMIFEVGRNVLKNLSIQIIY
jgi:predicted Zn-dependent peptidase